MRDDLAAEWMGWRLVISEVATLEEIERHYSLDDVYRLNAMLDMKSDMEAQQQERTRK